MGLDYEVPYSSRRTFGITVERDGSVIVRAPESASREKVHQLVSAKKRWIEEKTHSQKYKAARHPPGKELVAGESMLYLGRNYRIEMVESGSDQIEFHQRFLVPRSMVGRGRAKFQEWYVQRAEERLIPRAADWAGRLGVEPSHVRIADLRFRWGSCTPAASINLNWRLIKAPSGVADYVIVHELAHLLEANHGDRFWSIIRSQIPRTDATRNWLKEQGHLLEEDF